MQYVSTRGAAPALNFADVLLVGVATDGGLYVPESVPPLPADWDRPRPYAELATEVMWPYLGEGFIERDHFAAMVADAYAGFEHPDVVPVRQIEPGLHLAELFWGPTLAFKDLALQLVGRLFEYELARRGERVTVIGATSGDTGSAAIEALRDRDAVDCVILHPHGRVSEVQRRQMTTVDATNVTNLAVEGTFDDCQDLVKAMFADVEFRQRMRLSAVNSINFARILAQIVYYVSSTAALRQAGYAAATTPVSFVVPTGNFGNVYAGHLARRAGLPISRLLVASNANDILTRFFTTATMATTEVCPTLSPSMDIQVSSNLERVLWELLGERGEDVDNLLRRFRAQGRVSVQAHELARLQETYAAYRADDDACLELMARYHQRHGLLVDPHTAVALSAAEQHGYDADHPLIVLSTAHPAKFADAVQRATGVTPALPPRLADLLQRPERYRVVANDLITVEALVDEAATAGLVAGSHPPPGNRLGLHVGSGQAGGRTEEVGS
ncbi:MAG: threonine synthase [Acidimicrobiales bacterium]